MNAKHNDKHLLTQKYILFFILFILQRLNSIPLFECLMFSLENLMPDAKTLKLLDQQIDIY